MDGRPGQPPPRLSHRRALIPDGVEFLFEARAGGAAAAAAAAAVQGRPLPLIHATTTACEPPQLDDTACFQASRPSVSVNRAQHKPPPRAWKKAAG